MTAVAIRDLTKYFGKVPAVQALTFDAPAGQITGFIGPNGAGKTTTLRIALGLVRPTAGEALIGGQPYATLTHPRRVVGAVLDAPALHPARTGRDHLRVLAASAGVPERRVDEMLGVVQLEGAAGRRVRGYSMGMRQRLGLAGALLGDPAVLILDEPANGLDPAGVVEIRELLAMLAREKGVTIFMSSHILTEVDRLATRIGIIHKGRLIEELDTDRLEKLRAKRLEVRTRNLEAAQISLQSAGYKSVLQDGMILIDNEHAIEHPDDIAKILVNAGTPPMRLAVEQQDLEGHFLQLTGGAK